MLLSRTSAACSVCSSEGAAGRRCRSTAAAVSRNSASTSRCRGLRSRASARTPRAWTLSTQWVTTHPQTQTSAWESWPRGASHSLGLSAWNRNWEIFCTGQKMIRATTQPWILSVFTCSQFAVVVAATTAYLQFEPNLAHLKAIPGGTECFPSPR